MPTPIFVLECTVALTLLAVARWIFDRSKSDVKYVPGPSQGHWLWGHERDIAENNVSSLYTQWFRKHGPIVRHKGALLQSDILSVADPVTLKYILSDNYTNFMKSTYLRPLVNRLMGKGIVWAEGDLHKRYRKALAPAFGPAHLREMTDPIFDMANALRQRLTSNLQERGGAAVMDVNDHVQSFALDVVCKLQFNHDTQGGTSEDAKAIADAWSEQINEGLKPSSFYGLLVLRMFPSLGKLPLSYFKKQSDIKEILTRNSMNYIESQSNHHHAMEEGGGLGSDSLTFLALLLKRMNAKGGTRLSLTEVVENINTLLIGGFETTSGAIKMCLYDLGLHTDVQHKLREELLNFGSAEPDFEEMMSGTKLPFLDAVVKESLRLHPTGGTTDRVATSDDVLPLSHPIELPNGEVVSQIRIRAGQLIQLPMRAINVWEEGERFWPERWLNKETAPSKLGGWSSVSTFSEGPRMCLGYKLAILEMKIAIFTLITNFTFCATGDTIETRISTTYQTRVVGREHEGAQLPMRVSVLDKSA